ncbi:MAG: metal ABC transporter permease [Fluviicola sp.]|nr:metal ABC transporter permease [Fluviicola sp.]
MFSDPTLVRVFLGTFLIGLIAAVVGFFTFLQKKALIGDAVSHAILPGVILAYAFSGVRETWILLIGAFVSGWLATQQISWLERTTKLKSDTVIAVVMSTFFALGLCGLSWLQLNPDDGQAGLSDFLFGKIAAISMVDIYFLMGIAIFILLVVALRFRYFVSFAFNREFMIGKGFSEKRNSFLLNTMIILAVAMGIQALGVVLMSALLIVPVASARMLTNKINLLFVVAIGIGCFSAVFGAYISTLKENMPTGPWIIMVLTMITSFAALTRWIVSKNKQVKHG